MKTNPKKTLLYHFHAEKALLLQSKAEDAYCNKADSAILKLSFVQASMEQIYCITKQTYVVITLFCCGMGHLLAFRRELHFVANTRFLGLFCADFYADIWDLTQILRRYLDKKSAADSSVVLSSLTAAGCLLEELRAHFGESSGMDSGIRFDWTQ